MQIYYKKILFFRKQIALLEENLESLEKRLRDEIKSTESYHLSKINALQTEMETKQIKHDEQIEKLIADYEKQIEKLRINYEQDLEALKNDQRSTIENIRQAKLFEFAALQESGSYLNTLKSASDNLEHATDNLQSMRTNIDSTIERMHNERDVQLEAKEKRLNGDFYMIFIKYPDHHSVGNPPVYRLDVLRHERT